MDPSAGVFQEESIVLYTHRIGEFQESQNIALHSLALSAPNHWGNTAFTSTCSGCFLLLLHCNGALGLHLWKGILVVGFKTSEPASISKYTQIKFPAVLTYKYTVDKNLLFDLRARTMGNSPTSIHTLINLVHSDSYIKLSVMYLEDVKRHQQLSRCTVALPSPTARFHQWHLCPHQNGSCLLTSMTSCLERTLWRAASPLLLVR